MEVFNRYFYVFRIPCSWLGHLILVLKIFLFCSLELSRKEIYRQRKYAKDLADREGKMRMMDTDAAEETSERQREVKALVKEGAKAPAGKKRCILEAII